MGYDFYGKWHAANEDGSFEQLQLGTTPEGDELAEMGRGAELFSMFGLQRSTFPIPPVRQSEPPAALGIQRYPDAPVQGCVTLTDLLAYDYESEAWQQRKFFLFGGKQPVSVGTRYLRECILPGLRKLARGREVYCTYVRGSSTREARAGLPIFFRGAASPLHGVKARRRNTLYQMPDFDCHVRREQTRVRGDGHWSFMRRTLGAGEHRLRV
ncbi:hypothetical protein [Deinococcus aluminii]|uniref:Uncharacterized protein n=1 Tax=Deinococcus aluminii TaxID=1656885 RepID=A0ABP9XHM9_9DEIO